MLPFTRKSILLLMINYRVTVSLGNPSRGDPRGFLSLWNLDGGEDGKKSWTSFLSGPTHPSIPPPGKIPLPVSRRIKGDSTSRESGKSFGMRL